MDSQLTLVLILCCSTLCQLAAYYSSTSVAQWSRVPGSSWTIVACQLLGPSWRCRSFVGRHFQPGHVLGWHDSAPQCAYCERETLGFELGESFSCCHNRVELDRWWKHPDPREFSCQAIKLHMRQILLPCIRPLCSIVWLLVSSYLSEIWLRNRGRRWILMLIVCGLCSWPSWHLSILWVEFV